MQSFFSWLNQKVLEGKVLKWGVAGQIQSIQYWLNNSKVTPQVTQSAVDDDYYKRIEAIQFTMSHDDGKKTSDIGESDIILLGVSRTSKTPTSVYLANRGFKTSNIPLVLNQEIPDLIKKKNFKGCVIGLYADPERLSEIRKNRVAIMKDSNLEKYTDIESIKSEVEGSVRLFKSFNFPTIDVTRKSVEETAASIIKIYEIQKSRKS